MGMTLPKVFILSISPEYPFPNSSLRPKQSHPNSSILKTSPRSQPIKTSLLTVSLSIRRLSFSSKLIEFPIPQWPSTVREKDAFFKLRKLRAYRTDLNAGTFTNAANTYCPSSILALRHEI